MTVGDLAGIGPEIVLKVFANDDLTCVCRPLIIADAAALRRTAADLGLAFDFDVVADASALASGSGRIQVYDLANVGPDFAYGVESGITGRASAEYIVAAVELWKAGIIDAVATAPISKAAIKAGGYDYPGHTEFLAELTGTTDFAMSFFAEKLRVVLLSTHVSLRDAIELVKKDKLVGLATFVDAALAELLGRRPRIAFAGLNPHASEGGLFGDEEAREISPAIDECGRRGLDVYGPFSPDTIFLRGFKGEFDAVISCYHDQATIAVKCLSFGASVNVTLGLPLVRTSVDHGTAFDIAGKNVAEFSSMAAAVKLAAELAASRAARS